MYNPRMWTEVDLTVLTSSSFVCQALGVMADHAKASAAGKRLSALDPDGNDGFRSKPCHDPIYRIKTSWSVRTLLATTVWASEFVT